MIVYSSLLSFQTPHSLPCVCSTLLIVCSSLIVCTCSSSPSVFSLCVPVSRCQFVFVSSVPAISMLIKFPVIPTPACVIDSAFASSLSVPLPVQQLSTRVPNLDWISFDFCCYPTLIGILCLLLDCHSVYRNHSVKVISGQRRLGQHGEREKGE